MQSDKNHKEKLHHESYSVLSIYARKFEVLVTLKEKC